MPDAAAPCPACRRPLNGGRCFWCRDRPCVTDCGRLTGSCYIRLCIICAHRGEVWESILAGSNKGTDGNHVPTG